MNGVIDAGFDSNNIGQSVFDDNLDYVDGDSVDSGFSAVPDIDVNGVPDDGQDFRDTGNVVTGSGNDVSGNTYVIDYSEPIDYDALAEIIDDSLQRATLYQVYPSSAAIQVYRDVVQSIDGDFGYVVMANNSSNDVYLYFSKDYDVSGNKIYLHSPVTYCRYYTYRPSSSSSTQYLYQVSSTGNQTFDVSSQLVYTNLKEGYPDLLPYKRDFDYMSKILICICMLLCVFGLYAKGNRKDVG